MLSALLPLCIVAAVALADPQTPMAPIRIEPAAGGGNPVVVSLTGVEQDPVPLAAKWSTADACVADVACFVSSWMEANSTGSVDHLLALRAPDERADVQKRLADPQVVARNTTRFNDVRKWSLLGWAEYGAVRVVFLVKDDQSSTPIYTLPIKRVSGRWTQTDALAADPGFFEIFNRIGRAILARHPQRK
jgi:hypothetical protein